MLSASINDRPSADLVRNMVLERFTSPVVFHGFINDWEIMSWTLDTWSEKLGNKALPFRSGIRTSTKFPQWEAECEKVNLTLREFLTSDSSVKSEDSQNAKWLYFDYKYMNEWFAEQLEVLNAVTWKNFGFPERGGAESTLWIGNNGAHTPCHMDTYGCNMVAQVYGRKQWILFPPETTSLLLPTRIPYEESSIYSNINFYSPVPTLENELEAYVITLNPGDVLFVPCHWWHYVENHGVAISINSWIPMPSDDDSRLQEALVRFFISQVCKDMPEQQQLLLLNPNEVDLVDSPLSVTTQYVDIWRNKCKNNNEEERSKEPVNKKVKLNEVSDECSSKRLSVEEFLNNYKESIKPVPKYTTAQFKHLLKEKWNRFGERSVQVMQTDKNTIHDVVNAFCHPVIISKVKDMLLEVKHD